MNSRAVANLILMSGLLIQFFGIEWIVRNKIFIPNLDLPVFLIHIISYIAAFGLLLFTLWTLGKIFSDIIPIFLRKRDAQMNPEHQTKEDEE